MHVMSLKKCKELDKYAIEVIGIPSIVLMENAATEVTNEVKDKGQKFVVICGEGNNGGDGLAVARKLIDNGKEVFVLVIGKQKQYSNDFITNLKILKNMGIDICYIKEGQESNLSNIYKGYDVIIDSIFGVGLNRELNNFYKNIIQDINRSKCIKVAIDVPSGLNADTGRKMGISVKADFTYTFEVIKKGFITYNALKYLGKLKVLKIGIPSVAKNFITDNIKILEHTEYSNMMRNREVYGHKGNYGKIAVIAGSKGYTGAAYLVTQGCLKTGAGLTTLISTSYVQNIISNKIAESMTVDIDDEEVVDRIIDSSDIIAIGPGVNPVDEDFEKLFYKISSKNKLFVIDAGALDIIKKNKEILKNIKGKAILTPHPGEMARLVENNINYIEKNRIDIAKNYAQENGVVVLLKGYNTVITDGENVYINKSGNSKMASGGMGDTLTGIIAGLLGQKNTLIEAAVLGAYIHGLAGEEAGHANYSIVASDLIDKISKVMDEINT